MPKTVFEKDPPDAVAVVAEAIRRFHPKILEAELKLAVIKVFKFDRDDLPVEPTLKLHGAAVAGLIRAHNLKKRLMTGVDASIELDGHRWNNLPQASRLALVDHELNHIVLLEDDEGRVKRDDVGRPCLKLRPDDWTLTGFSAVVARHGQAALEYQSVTRVNAAVVEMLAAFNLAAGEVANLVDPDRAERPAA